MNERNLRYLFRYKKTPGFTLPTPAQYGEPFVNIYEGRLFFSGYPGGNFFDLPERPGFFEVGGNVGMLNVHSGINVNNLFIVTGTTGQIITYSGVTDLSGMFLSGTPTGFILAPINSIVLTGASTGDSVRVQPGVNTYTGGTDLLPTVNVSAATLDNLSVSGQVSVEYVDFASGNTVNPLKKVGRVFYDSTENALSYYPLTKNMDVTLNVGQESFIKVYNLSASTITNGQVVYINGSASGWPTVALATATDVTGDTAVITGVATHDIEYGEYGFITEFGIVRDLNLSPFTAGDVVYLSDTTLGGFDTLENIQIASRRCKIGRVIDNDATNGKLLVVIQNEIGRIYGVSERQETIFTLESTSTGLFQFSGLSYTSAYFNVAPVKGWVVDNTSNVFSPSIKYVDYSGQTGVTSIYLTSHTGTYLLIDSASTLVMQSSLPTAEERRDNLYIGKVTHPNYTTYTSVQHQLISLLSPFQSTYDMFSSFKFIREGLLCSANGTNLNFDVSSGKLYGFGINFPTNAKEPNELSFSAKTPVTFRYRTQTGGTASDTTTIDPLNYDSGGVVTAIPGSINRATNQRIYLFPGGEVRVGYGQQYYDKLVDAIAAVQTETFVEYSNFAQNAMLIGILSVTKGATALNDTSTARFIPTSKFGENIGGTAGITTATLQTAYDNSVEPEIVTDSTRQALTLKGGTGSDTDNVLEIKNNASGLTAFIRADGYSSFNSITATTISGNTLYSGGTNLYDLFLSQKDVLRVQPGTNIYTGGTDFRPTVNISGASLYDLSASGSVLFYSMSATSLSGQTIYSGDTELGNLLSGLFAPISVTNDVTRVQPGTNTYTGGTGLLPTVNISGASLHDLSVSGSALFYSMSATSLSGQTIYSGETELSEIIKNYSMESIGAIDGEPTGFPNRTDSVITFDKASNSFNISATTSTFDYYYHGQKRIKTSESVAITNATGNYYVYFDANDTLQMSTDFFDLSSSAQVAMIIRNTTINDYFLLDERHGLTMDWQTHRELHLTKGSYKVSGFGLSGYTIQPASPVTSANTYSVNSGIIADEDLWFTTTQLPQQISYHLMYLSGGTWFWQSGTTPYHYTSGGYIDYNSAGWTQAGNNNYVNYYICGVPCYDNSYKQIVLIPGQFVYTNATNAAAASINSNNLTGLPFAEITPIYKITYQTNSSYTSANGKCRIYAIATLVGENITIQGSSTNIHNNLGGLQGGQSGEYYHLTEDQHDNVVYKNSANTFTYEIIAPALSATTISGGTIYSGSTELGNLLSGLFAPISVTNDVTRVQPGTNTYTGGTGLLPTVNISGASLYDLSASGSVLFYSMSATSLSGQTIYSGDTELGNLLSGLFAPITITSDITRVQPGTNTYTGGTDNYPTVNISGASLDNIVVSGDARFLTLSAVTFSAETFISDITDKQIVYSDDGEFKGSSALTFDYSTEITKAKIIWITAADGTSEAFRIATDYGVNPSVFVGFGAGRLSTGTGNLFVGAYAGYDNTTGYGNIGIGGSAMENMDTGAQNIAIGSSALVNSTAGNQNTAIGTSALATNTGNYNTAIGHATLYDNDSSNNTAIGWYCAPNYLGATSVFIGYDAAEQWTTGDNNIVIGGIAGAQGGGLENVYIGYAAGYYGRSSYNVYIGSSAGFYSSGNNCLLIGYAAGQSFTGTNAVIMGGNAGTSAGGSDSVFVGYTAGYYSKGNYNTHIGSSAGNQASGEYVTTIGCFAGYTLTGTNAVAIGYGAGYNATAAANSVLIGYQAGYANGNNNVLSVGFQAGYNNLGANNHFVGNSAGYSNTTGTNNLFVGASAGYNTIDGSLNTFIGYAAGQNNVNGLYNVYLGATTGLGATGSYNVFIGYSAGYNETGSNKLYVDVSDTAAPLIYGEFDNNLIRINGRLDVTGDTTTQDILASNVRTTWISGTVTYSAGTSGDTIISVSATNYNTLTKVITPTYDSDNLISSLSVVYSSMTQTITFYRDANLRVTGWTKV